MNVFYPNSIHSAYFSVELPPLIHFYTRRCGCVRLPAQRSVVRDVKQHKQSTVCVLCAKQSLVHPVCAHTLSSPDTVTAVLPVRKRTCRKAKHLAGHHITKRSRAHVFPLTVCVLSVLPPPFLLPLHSHVLHCTVLSGLINAFLFLLYTTLVWKNSRSVNIIILCQIYPLIYALMEDNTMFLSLNTLS